MKKSLLLSMVLVMMLISACGNSGGKEAASSPDAKDTVNVWTYPVHGAYEDELTGLVADFQKNIQTSP